MCGSGGDMREKKETNAQGSEQDILTRISARGAKIGRNTMGEKTSKSEEQKKHMEKELENCKMRQMYKLDIKDGRCPGVPSPGGYPIRECWQCEFCEWSEEDTDWDL